MPINIAGTQLPARAWVPPSALLAECFAGALRLRRATGACLECREPLERSACPVARRNESCEARANEAPAEAAPAAPIMPPQPTAPPPTPEPPSAALSALLRGCASLTPRYGYTAPKHMQPPVARRNESCEARANEAPAEAAPAAPIMPPQPTAPPPTPEPPSAALSALLRGCASLTPRYGYPAPQAHAASRSAT